MQFYRYFVSQSSEFCRHNLCVASQRVFIVVVYFVMTQSGNFWIHLRSHLASQGIPRLLWSPKIHYHVQRSPPLLPLLSQMRPLHNFPPYFSKIHCNINLPSTPRSSDWFLRFRFPNAFLISRCMLMPKPSHPPWFDHPNNILGSV
jgi:hypothetical protein